MYLRKSAFAAAALVVGLTSAAQAADWHPEGNVEFIVGAGAGGENDRIARAIQRSLQEQGLVSSMTVLNKPGAGQTIAITDLSRREGDANTIGLASGSFINAVARTGSTLYKDVTPIMKLFDSYQCFVTKTDSPLKSMKDVRDSLEKDPTAITFGFPVGLGSPLHVAAVKVGKAAGVPPKSIKTVVFDSGTDLAAQVAGGHVNVGISSIGSAMGLVQSGDVRFLGIASPERLGGEVADVPTLMEQGVDVIVANSYTVLVPNGLTDDQIAFWTDAMDKVRADPEFKKAMDQNFWAGQPVRYPESVQEFASAYDENREILKEIGFAD